MRLGLMLMLLSGTLAFAPTAAQQVKHTPTFESCDADVNLWLSQIPGRPKPTVEQVQEGTKSLTVDEMGKRISHLIDCAQAYPDFQKYRLGELSALESVGRFYELELRTRLFHFIDRHGLTTRFYEEDEAGKR